MRVAVVKAQMPYSPERLWIVQMCPRYSFCTMFSFSSKKSRLAKQQLDVQIIAAVAVRFEQQRLVLLVYDQQVVQTVCLLLHFYISEYHCFYHHFRISTMSVSAQSQNRVSTQPMRKNAAAHSTSDPMSTNQAKLLTSNTIKAAIAQFVYCLIWQLHFGQKCLQCQSFLYTFDATINQSINELMNQSQHPISCSMQVDPLPKKPQTAEQQTSRMILQHMLGNYPHFRNHQFNDPRLYCIPYQYILRKRVLDIGCNQGYMTIPLAIRMFPQHICGIDIEKSFIKHANKSLQRFQKPKYTQNPQIMKEISELPYLFQQNMLKDHNDRVIFQCSPPINMELNLDQGNSKFPQNVSFEAANILTWESKQLYDTILCLRVVLWMHLAFGDKAIRDLFRKFHMLLKQEGLLLLEVHPDSSYRKRKGMNAVYRENYGNLEIQVADFGQILENQGFKMVKTLEGSQEHPLKRAIQVYQKE